ncbi:MAG: sigma-70 family RNA polymerase sigma factor [Actinomycetota bacterium]|nr:sigma-70 family RNA polymerase sigma factor [Actinomycetota bacterium]
MPEPRDAAADAANLVLFEQYKATGAVRLRNELVVRHRSVAEAVARRFSGRGEPLEDLTQVAHFALIRAVERYDPERGVPFVGFAVPTILGELKRHFRDKTWSGTVSRSVKELLPRVRAATESIEMETGSSATPAQIAEHLGVDIEQVIEALDAGRSYKASSLSTPGPSGGTPMGERIVAREDGIGASVDKVLVESLLEQLDDRGRRIVELRFYGEMSQDAIAKELGISQMHVSRLLRRALEQLSEIAREAEESV